MESNDTSPENRIDTKPHTDAAEERLEHFREGKGAPIENPIPQITAPTAAEQINEVIENLQKPETIAGVSDSRRVSTRNKARKPKARPAPKTVEGYVKARMAGKVPDDPEWLQFYENNSKEIEEELYRRFQGTQTVEDAVELKPPVPDAPKVAPELKTPKAEPKVTTSNVVEKAQEKLKTPKAFQELTEQIGERFNNLSRKEISLIGGSIAGGIGLAGYWLYQHRKDRSDFPRVSTKGFKRPNISGEEEAIKSSTLSASVLSGALVSALGSKYVMGGKVNPGLRSNLFLGGTFALNLATDLSLRQDPAVAIIASVGSTTAGYFALKAGKKWGGEGTKMIRQYVEENGPSAMLSKIYNIVQKAKSSSPFLGRMLSSSNLGFISAVATIPVAHSIIHRILTGHFAKSRANVDNIVGNQDMQNEAGLSGQRDNGDWSTNPTLPEARLRINGRIRTHYNEREALAGLI